MSNPTELPTAGTGLIIDAQTPIYLTLRELAERGRMVYFAGLPGTGKSLMIHQLAHLAHALGRRPTLLQWDIARPVFEAGEAGRRYPQVRGVTHGMIRVAAGLWARHAVAQWQADHPGGEHLLIGETPFVGHRLIELARPMNDAAEPCLAHESAQFVVPVPSREVRRHLESERERRAQQPLNEREKEDAPPHVLRDLWRQLAAVAPALGIAPGAAAAGDDVPYDPQIYQEVYLKILRHRHARALALDAILSAAALSAYDFAVPPAELAPGAGEVRQFLRAAEDTYGSAAMLQRAIERWYEVE